MVVDGNRRKYVQLGRSLRFYGGTTSATGVGCSLRCKFCFSDKLCKTQEDWQTLQSSTGLRWSCEECTKVRSQADLSISVRRDYREEHLFELLDLVEQSEFIYILETNGMTLGADLILSAAGKIQATACQGFD